MILWDSSALEKTGSKFGEYADYATQKAKEQRM